MDSLFALADVLKTEYRAPGRHAHPALAGRTLMLLFQRPSLRTRVTFEAGMSQLGGHAIYQAADVVVGARETVHDVARNLERFVDAIVVRTGPHDVVEEMAAQADVPVINGLTLREHPCQALADLFTIRERLGRLDGVSLAFVGDGNNVYHSLALAGVQFGMDVRLAHPPGYGPSDTIVERATALAALAGGRLSFEREPAAAVRGAGRRLHGCLDLDGSGGGGHRAPPSVRGRIRWIATCWRRLGHDALVMHCLPAHRGEEITSDVMDGPQSIVFEQSENRLHVAEGLLLAMLGDAADPRAARHRDRAAVRALQGRPSEGARRGVAWPARRRARRLCRGRRDRRPIGRSRT